MAIWRRENIHQHVNGTAPKKGLIYTAHVKLDRTTIPVENKTVNLTPGMTVTVEIKTGKRRVMEYFLSPLMEYQSESLKER